MQAVPDPVEDNHAVRAGLHSSLSAVFQEGSIVQDQEGRLDQTGFPGDGGAAGWRVCLGAGECRQSAQILQLGGKLAGGEGGEGFCLLVQRRIFYVFKSADFLKGLEVLHIRILHRQIDIPVVLIPGKAGLIHAEPGEGRKAGENGEGQKGESEGKHGGAQSFSPQPQGISRQLPLNSEKKGEKRNASPARGGQISGISHGLQRRYAAHPARRYPGGEKDGEGSKDQDSGRKQGREAKLHIHMSVHACQKRVGSLHGSKAEPDSAGGSCQNGKQAERGGLLHKAPIPERMPNWRIRACMETAKAL